VSCNASINIHKLGENTFCSGSLESRVCKGVYACFCCSSKLNIHVLQVIREMDSSLAVEEVST